MSSKALCIVDETTEHDGEHRNVNAKESDGGCEDLMEYRLEKVTTREVSIIPLQPLDLSLRFIFFGNEFSCFKGLNTTAPKNE